MPSLLQFCRTLYWSPLGTPIRYVRGTAVPPPEDKSHWDGQVSGFFAPRLGGTLSVDCRNQLVAELLHHKSPGSKSVLDLGCAGGTLASVLLYRGFERYRGVDISEVSIAHAKSHTDHPAATWETNSIDRFETKDRFDVIVFNEVLYYLDFNRLEDSLMRYADYLNDAGVFCVSLNLHPKSRAIVRKLKRMPLEFVSGILYQECTDLAVGTRADEKRPPYHTFLLRDARRR